MNNTNENPSTFVNGFSFGGATRNGGFAAYRFGPIPHFVSKTKTPTLLREHFYFGCFELNGTNGKCLKTEGFYYKTINLSKLFQHPIEF